MKKNKKIKLKKVSKANKEFTNYATVCSVLGTITIFVIGLVNFVSEFDMRILMHYLVVFFSIGAIMFMLLAMLFSDEYYMQI